MAGWCDAAPREARREGPQLHARIRRTKELLIVMRSLLRCHPFLALGLLGLALLALWLALGAQPHDGGLGTALFYSWRVLAAPVHLAANVLAPVTDRWPDALDAAAAVVAGLLPYAAADWGVRRWRRRERSALHVRDA